MWKRKPLFMLSLVILPLLIAACGGSSPNRVSNAEGYLEDLANGNINAAEEHVCERREAEIDALLKAQSLLMGNAVPSPLTILPVKKTIIL